MFFGGLLSSLYGDLPAPKSSSSNSEKSTTSAPGLLAPESAKAPSAADVVLGFAAPPVSKKSTAPQSSLFLDEVAHEEAAEILLASTGAGSSAAGTGGFLSDDSAPAATWQLAGTTTIRRSSTATTPATISENVSAGIESTGGSTGLTGLSLDRNRSILAPTSSLKRSRLQQQLAQSKLSEAPATVAAARSLAATSVAAPQSGSPGIAVVSNEESDSAVKGPLPILAVAAATATSATTTSATSVASSLNDSERWQLVTQFVPEEYDASKPNSYDEYCKERARLIRKQEEERRRQEELDRLREEQRRLSAATAAAAPSSATASKSRADLNISGEEAYQRRLRMSQQAAPPAPPARPKSAESSAGEPEPSSRSSGGGVAMKILQKMGWQEGEGLGREKQGIVAPLVAKKTAVNSAVIVQGERIDRSEVRDGVSAPTAAPQLPLSRVILLTNMVGRGEVDDELENETGEEASNFGNLLSVKIVQYSERPDSEAVRIFCEYETPSEAATALQSFNGRLFGGRTVQAQYYNDTLFESGIYDC